MSHDAPPSIWGRIFSRDHKVIGLQYYATAVVMALVGGVLALLIRLSSGPRRNVLLSASPDAWRAGS
jgi:heme/copper-type cytochrome/quinol oxidase subunit 1